MAVNNKITRTLVVIVLLLSSVLIAGCTSVSIAPVQPVQTGPMIDEKGHCVVVNEDQIPRPCTGRERYIASVDELN